MADTDPDHVHPDAQLRVQSPDEIHDVTGAWWNEYVDKAKRAGAALLNRIVEVIDDAGQTIRGFEPTPGPAPATPAPAPAAPADEVE